MSQAQLEQFERQLAQHGRGSLEKSRRALERRLREHLDKLEIIREAGGPTGSVDREIRNFQRQIEAIDEVLRRQQ